MGVLQRERERERVNWLCDSYALNERSNGPIATHIMFRYVSYMASRTGIADRRMLNSYAVALNSGTEFRHTHTHCSTL